MMQEIKRNKNIRYWHIQLHPNQINWNRERELLETTSLIGLGLLKKGDSQIRNFENVMEIGDIVLVKRGSTPIALVQIIGKCEYEQIDKKRLDWFPYRREIKILDYATDEMPNFPQPRGTLQKAINKNTASYKYIDDWYKVPLIELYKNSQYANQLDDSKTQLLRQTFKHYKLKKWLGKDDTLNRLHLEKLLGWISSKDGAEPIIKTIDDITNLNEFIDDIEALKKMEETGDVLDGLKRMYITKHLEGLKGADKYLVREDIDILIKLLPKESTLDIQSENISVCFAKGRVQHFDSLFIKNYKVFKDFKIDRLNRINIFAGFNNTGKTTLLEAIYLLTKQNNIGAFFELVKLKNKLSKLNTHYLNSYFQDEIEIGGNFNEVQTEIKLRKFEATAKEIDKKDDYIASYELLSTIDGDKLTNTIHTFEASPLIRYVDKVEIICNSLFKSPYFYNQQEIINTHSKNVELKVFGMVVEFISNHIDKNIQNINLTEKNDIKRFLVDSKIFPEKSVDITNYGEGLQRIFEIALAFAYCKNGVLLIDELETAIHYSLLVDFTKFIQELAVKFNVQVFITSHSKECIDAFVKNEFNNDEISAFFLKNEENNIKAVSVTGKRLKHYIDSVNFDLRGKNNG
jgi:AAA15 family ATPase/GTPase